jgi:hypothetical protein
MRRIVSFFAVGVAALLAILAMLSPSALGARAPGRADAQAKLVACGTDDQSLTVEGFMKSLAAKDTMQMRFGLQSFDRTSASWRALSGPGLDSWNKATTGIPRYRFQKRIENLPAPGTYRVVVRYRWLAGRKAFASASRTTGACVQPDPRPDLRVTKIEPVRLDRQVVQLKVRVTNAGRSAAGPFDVLVSVDGKTADTQGVVALSAKTPVDMQFRAPRCPSGSTLSVAVDSSGSVDEADEANNVKKLPCP